MARRIVHVDDWLPAQEAMLGDHRDSFTAGSAHRRASFVPASHDQSFRRLSLSLPWRRPKPALFARAEMQNRSQDSQHNDVVAVEDAQDTHEPSDGSGNGQGSGSSGSLRGMLHRASLSLKGMVHRRPCQATKDSFNDKHASPARPTTPYSTWRRLRHAASSRHVRSVYGLDFSKDSPHISQRLPRPSNIPVPAKGREPPIIPTHTGAAAKASAAMQNEFFARQSVQKRWLYAPSSEDGNDRESGIGIVVTVPRIQVDETDDNSALAQDASISRLDFISLLPAELAIHVLAFLDANALAKVGCVSRRWNAVVRNKHIWRESCLRETTATYATGGPVPPGIGLGIPSVTPGMDWKRVYRAKHELSQRWKGGKARPVYLNGHLDSIYCLQFDEYKIVSGSRDKTIRVWDMHTLECRLIIGPPEVVYKANLLCDDKGNATHYASGSDSRRTAQSTPTVASFAEHHKASILCLQYDDKILVTGSSDASCIVYDMQAGYRPMRRLRHHTAAVLDLAFDDKHIVTCSKDISICVWDRETGNLLRQLRGHTGPVNAVQMRGNTIVSCSGDFRVKLWNVDTGKNIREFVGHTKGLACSQFSEDGRYVASAGNDKVIRIWDANTGECLREMQAHENLVRSLHIDSVSGRLISGSYDTDIKVWDMETGHQLLDFPRWHASWVLSAKSDYRRIVSTGQAPKILIMDFGAGVDGVELLERQAGADLDKRGFI
ncbi:WD40 repeat-like-containing domain protein [Ophiocordyceps sinensis CO18]|uniref:WD40 repeat-like-containing domain protein n=1 Tax=Ophiocordyceps sinensis (strain Co18 / CGMCC 3.14243) TaxID=911162 RepID=T5A2G9_OPHSC|nr:WD40 repeat-like-containing domain protein [Ophiocordyceps sinensis CO18]